MKNISQCLAELRASSDQFRGEARDAFKDDGTSLVGYGCIVLAAATNPHGIRVLSDAEMEMLAMFMAIGFAVVCEDVLAVWREGENNP
jgi:hypothetical protein